jgi:hypothetical protein
MKRAERMIRQQIEALTIDRIAPRKHELEQSIKWMYWQGTFRKKKYEQLLQVLEDKNTDVMNKYDEEFDRQEEIRYQEFRKRYGLDGS